MSCSSSILSALDFPALQTLDGISDAPEQVIGKAHQDLREHPIRTGLVSEYAISGVQVIVDLRDIGVLLDERLQARNGLFGLLCQPPLVERCELVPDRFGKLLVGRVREGLVGDLVAD